MRFNAFPPVRFGAKNDTQKTIGHAAGKKVAPHQVAGNHTLPEDIYSSATLTRTKGKALATRVTEGASPLNEEQKRLMQPHLDAVDDTKNTAGHFFKFTKPPAFITGVNAEPPRGRTESWKRGRTKQESPVIQYADPSGSVSSLESNK